MPSLRRAHAHGLALRSWWRGGDDRTIIVHPAFWRAALIELVALLDGSRTIATREGTEIDNLFPVTWV